MPLKQLVTATVENVSPAHWRTGATPSSGCRARNSWLRPISSRTGTTSSPPCSNGGWRASARGLRRPCSHWSTTTGGRGACAFPAVGFRRIHHRGLSPSTGCTWRHEFTKKFEAKIVGSLRRNRRRRALARRRRGESAPNDGAAGRRGTGSPGRPKCEPGPNEAVLRLAQSAELDAFMTGVSGSIAMPSR